MKWTNKDMADSMFFWGMGKIYRYGTAAHALNYKSISPKKMEEIEKATDIALSDTKVEIKAGERKTITATPDSSRDIVLWSTADDTVATVYDGVIHAKAGGVTTVYAKSQFGSVEKAIQVIVQSTGEETATAIKTEKAYYEMTEGDTLTLNASLTPANSKDAITYTSSNTSIATVSSSGKVTAENAGKTYIIVKAASGGITKLEDLTAIYIRDTNTLKPVVSAASIRYDKIAVNDKELTLKKLDSMDADGFKNLLKDNGQLDSNDPINGWDGCAVEEVSINSSKHSVSFTGVDNPTKISVTFTIKGMKFFPGKEKEKEATKIESVTANKIVMPEIGSSTEIELNMTPVTTDSEVTFYSTDSAVAVIDNAAHTVDADGKIKVNVTAVGKGTTTIVGITENGLKVFYTVGVGDMSADDLAEPQDPTPSGLDGSEPEPTPTPTVEPTATPTVEPTATPTVEPTATPNGAKDQKITAPAKLTKAIGSKAFAIKAKTDGNGKLTYKSSNTKVAAINAKGVIKVKAYGTTNIVINAAATNNYKAAQKVCKLTVTPKAVKVTKVTRAKSGKKISLKWKKDKTVKGYQVTYSTDKKFKKGVKKVTVKKAKTVKKTISKGIKAKKKCYVKVRSYVKAGGKTIYGPYSKVRKVSAK